MKSILKKLSIFVFLFGLGFVLVSSFQEYETVSSTCENISVGQISDEQCSQEAGEIIYFNLVLYIVGVTFIFSSIVYAAVQIGKNVISLEGLNVW